MGMVMFMSVLMVGAFVFVSFRACSVTVGAAIMISYFYCCDGIVGFLSVVVMQEHCHCVAGLPCGNFVGVGR